MAYNEQLADRIRELIAARENQVEEKQMFGGLCFMVNDMMCVTTREDHIMVRLGPEDYEVEVLGEGCSPMVHGGREMKGFIFVSADTLGSTEALRRWVDLALDFNSMLEDEPEDAPDDVEGVTVVVIDGDDEEEAAPKKVSKKAASKKAAPKKAAAKKAPPKKASKKAAPKKATKKTAKKVVKKAVKKAAPAKKATKKSAKKAPTRKAAKKGRRRK